MVKILPGIQFGQEIKRIISDNNNNEESKLYDVFQYYMTHLIMLLAKYQAFSIKYTTHTTLYINVVLCQI